MKLYKDVLIGLLMNEAVEIRFPDVELDINQLVEMKCYQTLKKIQAVIEDESLEDEACFMKIEEIICAFEAIGSSGGVRHDFG